MTYKMMKVFDSIGMPEEVLDALNPDRELNNNTFITFSTYTEDDYMEFAEEATINNWLLDNGANVGDVVLIKYWW